MNPEVLSPTEYEYYKQTNPPKYSNWNGERTPAELARDINAAHDRLRKQVRVNDKLVAQLRAERRWRKILAWAISGTWSVMLVLLKALFPLILKGLAK